MFKLKSALARMCCVVTESQKESSDNIPKAELTQINYIAVIAKLVYNGIKEQHLVNPLPLCSLIGQEKSEAKGSSSEDASFKASSNSTHSNTYREGMRSTLGSQDFSNC